MVGFETAMYMLTIAKGYNFLLYFILSRSSMALQPLTSVVNNDNLITTAVRQQMKSCFLTLGRWENGQA